jgi:hypothetical protein
MATTPRRHFSGDESIADSLPHHSTSKLNACMASQCRMVGSIFPGAMHGATSGGVCVYHYGVVGADIVRVTQMLADWECVTSEINTARRLFTDIATCADPTVLAKAYTDAWQRLQPLVTGWEKELSPGRDLYAQWIRRLEAFLGGQIANALRNRVSSKVAA